jgi:hypothetical protein
VTEVIGTATVAQIFNVKVGKVQTPVAGSKVHGGLIERKGKYRLVRGDKVIANNLKI